MHSSRTADALLGQIAVEKGVDVAIISEQYGRISQEFWFEDETGTAALWMPGGVRLAITRHGADCGYVYFRVGQLTLISCYLIPSDIMDRFRMKLDAIEDRIREMGGPFIVAGDFDARAVEWGDSATNSRGRCILDMAAKLGLTVANLGGVLTFRRPGCEYTTPDITLVTESWAGNIDGWKVLKDYTGSDHQYITFRIVGSADRNSVLGPSGARRRSAARLNPESFLSVFDRLSSAQSGGDADVLAGALIRRIIRGCDSSMPRVTRRADRRPVYWWTPEIAELRRACVSVRIY